MRTLFIVGNKFRTFHQNQDVMTIAEFKNLILQDNVDLIPIGTKLVVGQGVRDAEVQQVLDIMKTLNLDQRFDLGEIKKSPVRAGKIHTHKYLQHNSIISYPCKYSDNLYETQLMLDERCELMGDHQTGQHIQGMLVIEAARQTFLAVTEEFFIGPNNHHQYYFVINSMDVRFMAFLFPIDIIIKYEIIEKDIDTPDRMKFRASISFIQNCECASQVTVGFTAYQQKKIKEKEQLLAQEAITKQQTFIADAANKEITSNAA